MRGALYKNNFIKNIDSQRHSKTGVFFISKNERMVFMEKIKLLNGQEFPAYDFEEFDDQLKFTVFGVEDFQEFRKSLTADNLSTIEVYTEGDTLSTVFEGYGLAGKFDIVESGGVMDVTVYLEKPDPVLQRIAELEAEVAELKATKTV
jgi:hypothetical protein